MANDNDTTKQNQEVAKPLDFSQIMLSGLTLGDARLIGLNRNESVVFNPDMDEFKKSVAALGGDPNSPDIEKAYNSVKTYWDIYKTNGYDPYIVKGDYDYGGDPTKEYKFFPTTGFNTHPMDVTKGFLVNMENPTIQHEQQNAEEKGFFINKDGVPYDLKSYNEQKNNPLFEVYDKDTGNTHWEEAKDGQLVTADVIRPAEWLGGANVLKSGAWSAAARGIYQGAVVKTVQGVQGLVGGMFDIYRAYEDDIDNTKYTGVNNYYNKKDSELSGIARWLVDKQNWINQNSRMSKEESEGVFSNWNSFVYNLMDGVGQIAPMIASSYSFGLIGMGQKLSVAATKVGGSLSVFGIIRNQMLEDGYTPEEAGRTALAFGAMTYASESVFNADLTQKYGYRLAQNMTKTAQQKATRGLIKEGLGDQVTKEMGETIMGGASREGIKGFKGWLIRFRSAITDMESPGIHGTVGQKVAYAMRMGAEEGTEELIEGIGQNKLIAPMVNSYAQGKSKEILDKYDGLRWEEVQSGPNKGLHIMHTTYGEDRFVNDVDKDAIERDVYFANKVKSGDALLDEGINMDEAFIAGLSSLLTGGLLSNVGNSNFKKKSENRWALASAVAEDPSKRAGILKEAQEVAKTGALGDATQSAEYINQFMNDIDLDVQFIKDKGLNSPSALSAMDGDKGMMYELFFNTKNKAVLEEAIKRVEAGEDIKKVAEEIGDLNRIIDPSIDDLRSLQEKEKRADMRISALTEKREFTFINNKGKKQKAKRTQAYADKYFNVESYNQILENDAKRMARDSFMFNKKAYDKFLGKGSYEEQLAKRTEEMKKTLMQDPSFNGRASLFLQLTGSLSAQFDEFRDKIHRNGLEKTLESFQSYVISQGLNEDEISTHTNEILGFMDEAFEVTEAGVSRKTTIKETLKKIAAVTNTEDTKLISDEEVAAVNQRTDDIIRKISNLNRRLSYSSASPDEIISAATKIMGEISTATEGYEDLMQNEGGLLMTAGKLDLAESIIGIEKKAKNAKFDPSKKVTVPKTIKEALQSEDFIKYLGIRNSDNTSPNMWSTVFSDPELFKNFSPNAIALLNGFMFYGSANSSELTQEQIKEFRKFGKGQKFGDNIFSAFTQLKDLMDNQDIVIENPHVIKETIEKIVNAFNSLEQYITLNKDIIQDELEANDNTKEFSRLLNMPTENNEEVDNESLKLTNEDVVNLREFAKMAINIAEQWGFDERLLATGRDSYRMKIFAGDMALKYDQIVYAYENGMFSDNKETDKAVKDALNKVDAIVASIQKQYPKSLKEGSKATLWDISVIYSNIREKDKANDVRVQVMKAFSIMADLKETIINDDKAVEKLVEYADKVLAHSIVPYGHLQSYTGVEIYGMATATYDGYFSRQNFEKGRALFTDGVRVGQDKRTEYDFFAKETFNFAHGLKRQKGLSTDKDILNAYRERVSNQEAEDNVETLEQMLLLLHVIPFIESRGDSVAKTEAKQDDKLKELSKNMLPGFLSVLGYAGAGKTELMLNLVTDVYSKLKGEELNILIINPTSHLQIKHQEGIKKVSGKVNVDYIYQHEFTNTIAANQKDLSQYDIVFVEESGLLNDATDLNAFRKANLSKGKPKTAIIGIGDLGQTPSVVDGSSDKKAPVGLYSEDTKPLTEVFRTGVVSLVSLQMFFRRLKEDQSSWRSLPTAKWRKYNGRNVGLRYIKEESNIASKDMVKKHFVEAMKSFASANKRAASAKEVILVVETYKEKEDMIKLAEFEKYANNIFVLDFDSSIVAKEPTFLDWNVSGVGANEVYLAYSPNYENTTMTHSSVQDIYGKLLTGISRASNYAELVIREGDTNPNPISDTDDISGYEENIDQAKALEEKKRKNEEARTDRMLELDTILEGYKEAGTGTTTTTTTTTTPSVGFNEERQSKFLVKSNNEEDFISALSIVDGFINQKAEDAYKNVATHITEKYAATSSNPVQVAIYRMQSMAMRFALENENSQLYDSMLAELNKSVEDLFNVNDKFKDFTQEQKNAYRATVIANARVKANLIKENYDNLVPNVSITDGEYGGRPLGIEVVGYFKNKKGEIIPVVNIHGLSLKGHMGTAFVDDIMVNRYGAYATMLARKGMKVNGVVMHRIVPGQEGLNEAGLKSEFVNPLDIAKGIENAKNDLFKDDKVEVVADMNELFYGNNRVISVPANAPNVGINILFNGERGFVYQYEASFENGKVNLYAEIHIQETDTWKIVPIDDLYNSMIMLRNTRSQKGETVTEWMDGNVYSNMAFVHSSAFGLVPTPGQKFWDWNNNEWMRVKDAIAQVIFEHHSTMQFAKIFMPTVETIEITKDGKVGQGTSSFSNVLVNVILDKDIPQIIKEAQLSGTSVNTIEKFKSMGMHIVSFDSAPETLLTQEQVEDKALMKGQTFENINIETVLPEVYTDYMDGKIDDAALATKLSDHYKSIMGENPNPNQVDMNVYRMRTLKNAIDQFNSTNKSNAVNEVVVGSVQLKKQMELPFKKKRAEGQGYAFTDLKKNAADSGYTIEDGNVMTVIDSDTKRATIMAPVMKGGKIIGHVPLIAKRIEQGDLNELRKEFKEELDTLAQSPEWKKSIEEYNEALEKEDKDLAYIKKFALIQQLETLDSFAFLNHNRGYFAKNNNLVQGLYFTKSMRLRFQQTDFNLGLTDMAKAINQLFDEVENGQESMFRPIYRLNDKGQKTLIEDNIVTDTDTIFQKRNYFTKVSEKSPKGKRGSKRSGHATFRAVTPNTNEISESKEQVIKEVATLIGEAAHSRLFFRPGYFEANGVMNYAYVHNGLIKFGQDGKVSMNTLRHESMHFIIDYILTPEAARKVIDKAKAEKSRRDNIDIRDISDMDAHEYLADTFMVKRPATTIIGKFIQFVQSVIYRLVPSMNTINNLFAAADQGVFANTTTYNNTPNIDGAKYMAVENDFNTFDAIEKVSEIFGSYTQMEKVRDTIMMSSIMALSKYGKTIDASTMSPISNTNVSLGKAILNFHRMIVSLDNEQMKSVLEDYNISDRKFKMVSLSAEGEIIIGEEKEVQDISPEEYVSLIEVADDANVSDDIRGSVIAALNYYAYHQMKDPFVYKVMVQSKYPTTDVSELDDSYDDFEEVNSGALHTDNEEKFPDNSRKQVLKALMSNIPLYKYSKNRKNRVAHPSSRFIEIDKLDGILFRAAASAKAKRKTSFSALLNELEIQLEEATSGAYADLIYTFLVHFGDVNNNEKLAPNTELETLNMEEHVMMPILQLSSVGYMHLMNESNWDSIADYGYDEEIGLIKKSLKEKQKAYVSVTTALRSFYFSYVDKHLIQHEKNKGDNVYKVLTNHNYSHIMADMRATIHSTHFTQELDIAEKTKEAFLGDNQYILMSPSTIKMVVGGKWMDIVQVKNGVFSFGEGITTKELEEVFRFVFGKKISRGVITNILKGVAATKTQTFNAAEQIYYMLNGLYVSSIQLTNIADTKAGMDPAEITNPVYKKQRSLQESYYSKSNYSPTVGDSYIGDELEAPKDRYYSPADQWNFISDIVAYNTAYESMNEGVRTTRNVDGTVRSTYVQSDTLSDLFPSMDFNEDTSVRLAEIIKNDIQLMNVDNPLGKDGSFNNPILSGDMRFSSLREFIGITDKRQARKGKDLTTHDMFYEIFNMTKANLTSKGMLKIPVLLETLGDRSQMIITEWHKGTGAGSQFFIIKTEKNGNSRTVKEVIINPKDLTSMITQLISYAENQRTIVSNKWKTYAGKKKEVDPKSEAGKAIQKNLVKGLEYVSTKKGYVIGNGFTQATNPYKDMTIAKWNSIQELRKESGIAAQGEESLEKARVDWLDAKFANDINDLIKFAKEAGVTSNDEAELKKHLPLDDKQRLAIETDLKEMAEAFGEYVKGIAKDEKGTPIHVTDKAYEALQGISDDFVNYINKFMDGQEFTYGSSIDFINEIASRVDLIKKLDKSFSKAVNDQKSWDRWKKIKNKVWNIDTKMGVSNIKSKTANESIIRGMFYSHHIFNSSMNQLVRGTEDFYNNVPDFFKRGSGLTSPGGGFSTEILGATSNYVQVSDPIVMNKLFGDERLESTDGLSIMNPLSHRRRRLAAGDELGNVSMGAQKNGYFKFDAGKQRWSYYKFSEMPINGSKVNDPFYRSVLKMMLSKRNPNGGDTIWERFGAEITHAGNNKGKGFSEIMDRAYDYAEQNGIPMIDGMIFSSSVKFGSKNALSLKGDVNSGLLAYDEMANDENINAIDNNFLRLQTIVAANTFDTKRTISTQLLYIMGVGSHNKAISNKINEATSEAIEETIDVFNRMAKDKEAAREWIKNNAARYIGDNSNSQKIQRLIFDNKIDTDTWSKKVFDIVIKQLNSSLRPTLPGINAVQMPSLELYFEDSKGNLRAAPYTTKDLSAARRLHPLRYGLKNKEGKIKYFTTRKEFEDALKSEDRKMITHVPGEVVMPFVYAKKFGLSKYTSMVALMDLKGENMRTPLTERHLDFNKTKAKIVKLFGKAKSDNDFIKYIHKDVFNEVLRRSKLESVMDDSEKFINELAHYYMTLNKSLDIYHVRIPTSNASLGGTSRIVEFSWDYENTIFISPEKNILDDSDYDIDELHTYTRPLALSRKEEQTPTYKMQKAIFDGVIGYYSDNRNAEYILQRVNPGALAQYTDDSQENSYLNSTLNNTLDRKKISNDGKETVGHFVTLQNVISRLFQLSSEGDISERSTVLTGMELFSDQNKTDKETTLATIDILSKLITSATDNLKLEGLLGKLNISKETTPIVAGMIVSGMSEAEIFEMLKNPAVEDAAKKLYRSNSVFENGGQTIAGVIQAKIGDKQADLRKIVKANKDLIAEGKEAQDTESLEKEIRNLNRILRYSLKGEALRRVSDLTKIQGGFKSDPYALYQTVSNLEKDFGKSIDDIINGTEKTITEQLEFVKAKYGLTATQAAHEESIRTYVNLNEIINIFPQLGSYARITNAALNVARTASDIYDQAFAAAELLSEEASKGMIKEKSFPLILAEMEKMNLGLYLSSLTNVELTFGEQYFEEVEGKKRRKSAFKDRVPHSYNFSIASERERFFVDFNTYAMDLKNQYPDNFFLQRIESRGRYDSRTNRNDMEFVEFANSNSIPANKAAEYAAAFQRLPEKVKKSFRLYQAVTFGFNYRNGSFADVIDNQLERDFSDWKKLNPVQELFGYGKELFKQEVYSRIPNILTSAYSRPYYNKINGTRYYAIDGATKKVITSPYSEYLNSYTGKQTTFDVPFGYKIDSFVDAQLNTSNKAYVKTKARHRVKEAFRETQSMTGQINTEESFRKKYPQVIFSGDTVVLSNGELATVNRISSMEFSIETKRVLPVRKSLINRDTQKAFSEDILDFIISKLKKSFPNINIELVDNKTAKMTGFGYAYNGKVFLNTDKLQLDTPIHEFTHLFVDIIKATHPEMYSKLRSVAKNLLDMNDKSIQDIISAYEGLSEEDLLEEIIANITGWNSEQKVIDAYFRAGDTRFEQKGRSLWNKIKSFIQELSRSIKSIFKSAFNISEDMMFEFDTLQEFADKFTNMVIAGGVISTMTSAQLANMESAALLRPSVMPVGGINTVAKLMGFFSEAGQQKRTIEHEKMLDMHYWKNIIEKADYKLGEHILGREIQFTQSDLDNNSAHFMKVFKEIQDQDKALPSKLIDFLNSGPTSKNATLIFGRGWKEDSRITMNTLRAVAQALNYMPGRKYYSVSEFAKMANIEIDNAFLSEDFIISVEYNENKAMLISVYNATNDNLNSTESDNASRNILAGLTSAWRARSQGVDIKNTKVNLKRMSMGLFINYIQAANPNIKVNHAGIVRVVSGDSQYAPIDMATMNQLYRSMGKIDGLMELISEGRGDVSLKGILSGKNIAINKVDWNNVLASFYLNHDHIGNEFFTKHAAKLADTHKNKLSRNDKIEFLQRRLQQLIRIANNTNDENEFSRENHEEIRLILNALNALKNPSILNEEINRYEDIDLFQQYMLDTNSIGEEHFIMLKSAYHNASFDVVKKHNDLKMKLRDVWEYFTSDVKGYTGNPGKQRFERMFDTIEVVDENGNKVHRRTGGIYWTNKESDCTTQIEREMARRALERNISEKDLAMGKRIVDVVTELYIGLVLHNGLKHKTADGLVDLRSGEIYNRESAIKDLAKSRYYRGFMPMMRALSEEARSNGSFAQAATKFYAEQADAFTLYQDSPNLSDIDNNEKYVSELVDRFYSQIALDSAGGKYGSTRRMSSLLGISSDIDERGNPIFRLTDPTADSYASYDLQTMIDYFAMSTYRNTAYENEVLPISNALKIKLARDMKNQGGKGQEAIINMIDDFTTMAVQGQIKHQKTEIMVDVEKTFNVVGSVVKPAVMMLNPNVAVLSHFSNMFFIGTEAFANSVAKTSGIKLKSLARARALFVTDWSKITQLAVQMQVIDMTEYHMLHHKHRKVGDRNVVSSFMANYTNWMTDYYARAIVMTAKMVEDGSWDALTYNKGNGMVDYNYKRDRQFFDAEGKFKNKEAKVLFENLKTQLENEGHDVSKGPTVPYDKPSMRNLKIIADRSIGAFDSSTKALMGAHGLMKNATTFNGWMASKLSMAFGKKGKFASEGGEWIVVEEKNGELVPKWQREFVEGSFTTLISLISRSVGAGKLDLSSLSKKEQRNLWRLGAQLGLWAFIMSLFAIDWEEASKMLFGDKKYGTTAEKLKKVKLINSIKYAAESLTIIGPGISWAKEPFAVLNILSSSFTNAYGESSLSLITNIIPLSRLYKTTSNITEEISGKTTWEHLKNFNN